MKRVIGILAATLVVILMSACGKDPDEPRDVYFSVLGDSYSTFQDYVDPETNAVWSYYDTIGINKVEQMWWWQVAQGMGWTLDHNNSFSGSLVCNMNFANWYGPHSFLRRMDELGNPDVILVFGGTNDVWDEAPMGDFVYENWTEEELCEFRPALACLFSGLQQLYPQATVYFMADSDLGDVFMESVHIITDYYGVGCIDLYGIKKWWLHPNAEGMASIARQVMEVLNREVNA